MGIMALFVLLTSLMISCLDRVIPVSFSVWPFWLNFSFLPSCRCTLLSFLQAFWLLVLEEAFEEITVASKPIQLRVVRQMELPSIWSSFTNKSNEQILGANLRRLSSSFSTAVVAVIIRMAISKCWSKSIIQSHKIIYLFLCSILISFPVRRYAMLL